MYQIDVSPGNLQMYTSSNKTHKNVEGLSPGMKQKKIIIETCVIFNNLFIMKALISGY